MKRSSQITPAMMVVAVAVIAALLVVFLFSMKHEQEQGRRGTCFSQLKSISLSCHLYAMDWHADFPYSAGAKNSNDNFYLLLPNYMTTTKVFICPSDANCRHPAEKFSDFRSPQVNSYSYVSGLTEKNSSDSPLDGDNLMDVAHASRRDLPQYQTRHDCTTQGSDHGAGGGALIFVDGHAAWCNGPNRERKPVAYWGKGGTTGLVLESVRWSDAEGGTKNIKNPNGL